MTTGCGDRFRVACRGVACRHAAQPRVGMQGEHAHPTLRVVRACHPPRVGAQRGGFTLLELVVAAALSVVLVAGVWSLLSTYERLFTQGQTRVEQSQLLRALAEQISFDLRSAIPDTATGMPGAGGSVRRFGLFGTARSIQLDVLQLTPAQGIATDGELAEPASRFDHPIQAPELRTVQYWLEEARPGEADRTTALSGLIRRELDWETPVEGKGPGPAATGQSAERLSPAGRRRPSIALSSEPMPAEGLTADPEDPSVLQVPEVVGLEFRYFDGTSWSSQWSSLQRKSLPAAIEVILKLARPEDPGRRPVSRRQQEEELTALLTGEEPSGRRSGVRHRLLVWLPSTALARPAPRNVESWLPAEAPAATVPPPVMVYVPPEPPAPPVLFPSPLGAGPPGSSPLDLPDQWMRSGR